MGSQYIRDTTVRTSNKQEIKQDKTRNKKKQRGHPDTVFGRLSVFYDGLLGIYKRKW